MSATGYPSTASYARPEGVLSIKLRQYVAQCMGILDGSIIACYEVVPLLKHAWLEHDTQRRVVEDIKSEMRSKTTVEDIAFAAAELGEVADASAIPYSAIVEQIREASQMKTIVEVRYNMACNTAALCKRALEDYQRTLNDLHQDIQKLVADIRQLGNGKYVENLAELVAKSEECIKSTSPLQIIAGL